MSIPFADNLAVSGKKPDIERQEYATLADMKAVKKLKMPEMYMAYCLETRKYYIYDKANEVDEVLGLWRELSAGGGNSPAGEGANIDDENISTSTTYSSEKINTELTNKVDKEEGKGLSTNDFTNEDKLQIAANTDAINILNGDETIPGSIKEKVLAGLTDSKAYTDEQIAKLNKSTVIICDEKPTYLDGNVTYLKGGESVTIASSDDTWFYYTEEGILKQTVWSDDGSELTIDSAGSLDFEDLVSKSADLTDTYTGLEVDTSKVPTISSLQALENKVQGSIDTKLSIAQGVDNLGKVPAVNEEGNLILTDPVKIDDTVASDTTTYSSNKIDTELALKVSAEEGKGLSTNDLTDDLKEQYDVAYEDSHTHTNKDTLDVLGLDEDGELTVNGAKVHASIAWGDITGNIEDQLDLQDMAHTHDNKAIIDKLAESVDGKLLYNGEEVNTDTILTVDHFLFEDSDNPVANKVVTAKFKEIEAKIGTGGEGGASEAVQVSYENTDHEDVTNVKLALDKIFAKVYYVSPKITSFNMVPATTEYEIGQSVNSLEFTWTVNKDITSQSLTGCIITIDDRSVTYNEVINSNKTFTLTISDGENSATASKSIKFSNKAYWGSAAEPDSYDSAFILGLSGNKFASNKTGTYNITVANGEYGYLALPTSFGNVETCWIGGFEVTLNSCGTIEFTNASGGKTNYSIYRTEKSSLGSISMEIK